MQICPSSQGTEDLISPIVIGTETLYVKCVCQTVSLGLPCSNSNDPDSLQAAIFSDYTGHLSAAIPVPTRQLTVTIMSESRVQNFPNFYPRSKKYPILAPTHACLALLPQLRSKLFRSICLLSFRAPGITSLNTHSMCLGVQILI